MIREVLNENGLELNVSVLIINDDLDAAVQQSKRVLFNFFRNQISSLKKNFFFYYFFPLNLYVSINLC